MRWRDQRGSSSLIFVLAWSIILLSVAFAADFGRVFFLREQLRTAEDAAALAGALQLDFKVRMVFAREERKSRFICDLKGEAPPAAMEDCWVYWWEAAPDLVFEGWENEAWSELRETWSLVCTGVQYRCNPAYKEPPRCWVEPIESQEQVVARAKSVFGLNAVWGSQATLRKVGVSTARSKFVDGDPKKPRRYEVAVDAELEMKTYLLAAFGVETIPVKTLEHPPRAATAERVRRSDPLTQTLGDSAVTSPCDIP
jgi:hypothetical protein